MLKAIAASYLHLKEFGEGYGDCEIFEEVGVGFGDFGIILQEGFGVAPAELVDFAYAHIHEGSGGADVHFGYAHKRACEGGVIDLFLLFGQAAVHLFGELCVRGRRRRRSYLFDAL